MESYNLTRQEAADLLEISVRSLDRYVKSWKIRSEKKWESVYVNDNDVKNIHSNYESTPIIITNSEKKPVKKEQFNLKGAKWISEKMYRQIV